MAKKRKIKQAYEGQDWYELFIKPIKESEPVKRPKRIRLNKELAEIFGQKTVKAYDSKHSKNWAQVDL